MIALAGVIEAAGDLPEEHDAGAPSAAERQPHFAMSVERRTRPQPAGAQAFGEPRAARNVRNAADLAGAFWERKVTPC